MENGLIATGGRLLKTPTAQLGVNGGSQHPDKRREGGHGPTLADQVEYLPLLPTPTVGRSTSTPEEWMARKSRANKGAVTNNITDLQVAMNQLVAATPTAVVDWGPYARAVLGWQQVMGRMVPHPLEPGRNGKGILARDFVEWMMGLPEGWVTASGLGRPAQLKILGNGVVPQQARLAISVMWDIYLEETSARSPAA